MDSTEFENRKRTLAHIMHEMKAVMPPGYRMTLIVRSTAGDKHILITEDQPDLASAAIRECAMMSVLTGGLGTPSVVTAPPKGALQ